MDEQTACCGDGNKGQSGGSPVYGLGVIGAWVYYWKRADTPRDKAVGLAKGLAWPAFLVYEGLRATSGRPEPTRSDDYEI